jgi:hypothetical protein
MCDIKFSANWAMVLAPLYGWAVIYSMYQPCVAAIAISKY